jgi:hypothetical protein
MTRVGTGTKIGARGECWRWRITLATVAETAADAIRVRRNGTGGAAVNRRRRRSQDVTQGGGSVARMNHLPARRVGVSVSDALLSNCWSSLAGDAIESKFSRSTGFHTRSPPTSTMILSLITLSSADGFGNSMTRCTGCGFHRSATGPSSPFLACEPAD